MTVVLLRSDSLPLCMVGDQTWPKEAAATGSEVRKEKTDEGGRPMSCCMTAMASSVGTGGI